MEERLKAQQREYEAQMDHRKHVQEFIDKFRYNAKRASMVQSRIKHLEKLPELKPVEKEEKVLLKFPDVEKLAGSIFELSEIEFKYPGTENPTFSNVDLSATMESRICIVGENGAGKTTLLKLLMDMLTPTKGTRSCHRNLKFGYFSQHHVDQLDMTVSSASNKITLPNCSANAAIFRTGDPFCHFFVGLLRGTDAKAFPRQKSRRVSPNVGLVRRDRRLGFAAGTKQ